MEDIKDLIQNLDIYDKKTGIFYDLRTLNHKPEVQHVECPDRVGNIIKHFEKQEIFKQKNVKVYDKLDKIPRELVTKVHSEEYVKKIDNLWVNGQKTEFNDIYVNEFTQESVYLACGGLKYAVDEIMEGNLQNAFVCVRPPGHHAGADEIPSGFCFFNNVAIISKYLQDKYNLKRILVLDWDVHHGNGTQKLLKQQENVLFISLHRHDNGIFYPNDDGGNNKISEMKGMHLNIPWQTKKLNTPGNDEYIYAFEKLVVPIVQQYKPEFTLISSGLDASINDPLGGCKLNRDGFSYMTRRLMDSTNGQMAVILEGGYNLNQLPICSESIVMTLFNNSIPLDCSLVKQRVDEMDSNI